MIIYQNDNKMIVKLSICSDFVFQVIDKFIDLSTHSSIVPV